MSEIVAILLLLKKGSKNLYMYSKSINLLNMPPGYSYSSYKPQKSVSGFRRGCLCFSDDLAETNKQIGPGVWK